MNPLQYYLYQPEWELSPHQIEAFEALFASTPAGGWIDYQLAAPKWQFLSYLCRSKDLVLHGSQNLEIEVVEPRQALDVKAYSNQNAIYAAADGIWVIYYAIIDRQNFSPLSLFNACFNLQISPEVHQGPYYFFSLTHSALIRKPWCDGAIYILPRATFEQEPAQSMMGAKIVFPHWISPQAARPAAKLLVHPEDFPFLAQVHGHDDEKLAQLAAANPNGYPWPEAWVS